MIFVQQFSVTPHTKLKTIVTLDHVRQSHDLLDLAIFNRLASFLLIFLKLPEQSGLVFLQFSFQFGFFQRSSGLEPHDEVLEVDFGLGAVVSEAGAHCNRNDIKCNV